MEKVYSKVGSKNVCSMQIMQELPTHKHTEDFNQTTHVAPYEPVTINDNLSLT